MEEQQSFILRSNFLPVLQLFQWTFLLNNSFFLLNKTTLISSLTVLFTSSAITCLCNEGVSIDLM